MRSHNGAILTSNVFIALSATCTMSYLTRITVNTNVALADGQRAAKTWYIPRLGVAAACSYRSDVGTSRGRCFSVDMLSLQACMRNVGTGDDQIAIQNAFWFPCRFKNKSRGTEATDPKLTSEHVRQAFPAFSHSRIQTSRRVLWFTPFTAASHQPGYLPLICVSASGAAQWLRMEGIKIRHLSRVTDGSLRQPSAAELVTAVGSRRRQDVWGVPLG